MSAFILTAISVVGCNQHATDQPVEPAATPHLRLTESPDESSRVVPPAQGSNAAADTDPGIKAGREYDILKSVDLRAGPGEDQPPKVNEKASDLLGEIHYLSVDSSVTVRVHETRDGWADVQVTQPSHLTTSHRGWIPFDCIQVGASSNKVDGWIRHTCLVYAGKSTDSPTVGYLSPPSSVGVADDNSGWLRLIHGPIKIEGTDRFVDNPNFEGGLYFEASKFTTVVPYKWNK